VTFSPLGIPLLAGLVLAGVLYLLLGATDLPLWARIVMAILGVLAVPSLWSLVWALLTLTVLRKRFPPFETPEWMTRQADAWEKHGDAFARLGTSAIERFVLIGRSDVANGVEFTLSAVEIRDGGAEPAMVSVAITDDAGTDYTALPQLMEAVGGAGTRFTQPFIPAPPPGRRLAIVLDELYLVGPEGTRRTGPWRFEVAV
jgi:hypothetical protein